MSGSPSVELKLAGREEGSVGVGLEQIRKLFQTMLAEFGKPGATFSLKQLTVVGDHGFIVWAAESADNVYELGTDTFYVRGGKIQVQSFAGRITPRSVIVGRGARSPR